MRKKKRKIKIRLFIKSMLLFFIAIFLSSSAIMSLGGYMIKNRIENYFDENHRSRIDTLISMITDQIDDIETIGIDERSIRLLNQAGIQQLAIKNSIGKVIAEFDLLDVSNKKVPLNGMKPSFIDNLFRVQFDYKEEEYPIKENNQTIGTIQIGYLGRTTLTPRDLAFMKSLTNSFRIVFMISLGIAIIISYLFSRSVTKPIKKISKTAKQIQKGNLDSRTELKTNTTELVELSDTIDYLAETLQQEDYLRKQLTADMAHEIRTPLTTVSTFIEAFIDGVWEPNVTNLSKCYIETDRLNKLVDQLKDIANIEAANITYHNEPINLSDELISIVDSHRPIMSKKNIGLESDIESNIYVSIDKEKLKQIIDNLLSNAYRYTRDNGTTKVALWNDEKNIFISVSDNGIGISKEDLPYIFKRFYRADKSRNKETGGMGIGLTIVKNLIKLYRGKIHVDSTLNKGTTFTITLPKSSL